MWTARNLLLLFLCLRLAQYFLERFLAIVNRRYYLNTENQARARATLHLSEEEMQKALAYATDRYRFGHFREWFHVTVLAFFLAIGGPGIFENWAARLVSKLGLSDFVRGLFFFAILGGTSFLLSLPFRYFHAFVIEERHGFNRLTKAQFIRDRAKEVLLSILLGGPFLAMLLGLFEKAGPYWWIYAWGAVTAFSLFIAWLFPKVLAPLFNKFQPLAEGDLKRAILALAERVGFRTSGISVMDASRRSTHGNAYFTGIFGAKKIVLFDTLVEMLTKEQVTAVMAHELGHFKLHHLRWDLLRSTMMTGLFFFMLKTLLPYEVFYQAFSLSGQTAYGAFFTFSLWVGIFQFLWQPVASFLSRRNEFAADRFAVKYLGTGKDLAESLLRMHKKSHVIPLTHPLFSLFYHSHPPILERLQGL